MAVTPTTTTIKTGTTPTSGYMIGAFQASSPPFIVKKTFEVIDQVQSYRAVAKASAVSNAFQLEKLSAPADNAIIKEYRTPYTHTYFPVYSGATAVTRCENILLTYIFLDDIPLYYQGHNSSVPFPVRGTREAPGSWMPLLSIRENHSDDGSDT